MSRILTTEHLYQCLAPFIQTCITWSPLLDRGFFQKSDNLLFVDLFQKILTLPDTEFNFVTISSIRT